MPDAAGQTLPSSLREAVRRDLRPVRPLRRPAIRALWLSPWAIALLIASEAVFGLRRDAPALGLALTWGASVLEMALGLLLIAAALREAVPGTTLTRRIVGLAGATALLAVVSITWVTWTLSPTRINPAGSAAGLADLLRRDAPHRAAAAGDFRLARRARLPAPPRCRRRALRSRLRPARRCRLAPVLSLLRSAPCLQRPRRRGRRRVRARDRHCRTSRAARVALRRVQRLKAQGFTASGLTASGFRLQAYARLRGSCSGCECRQPGPLLARSPTADPRPPSAALGC